MADNYNVLDSVGSTKTFSAKDVGAGVLAVRHSIPDGEDVAEGATTDAAATAGSTGSVNAKLRLMTSQLAAASTAAKQPALGAAGTPSADVLSVQGITNGISVLVNQKESQTYIASIASLASAAACTALFTITGSASKTVKIISLRITATRTASGTIDLVSNARSTANTGGTSTAPTRVPRDSANAAATATVLAYTANPTLGTLVGQRRSTKMFINTVGVGASDVVEWNFTERNAQPVTLRGTGEVFEINLGGVTIAGGSFNITIIWTEE